MHEQTEEILSHLMGKARDVVKIALHSDPGLYVKPELISPISVMFSLADFFMLLYPDTENIQSTAG